LESYYQVSYSAFSQSHAQETGRAGRDGQAAVAWMVYTMSDATSLRANLATMNVDYDVKQSNENKVQALIAFVQDSRYFPLMVILDTNPLVAEERIC
jgi:superfamily II DNA helicase RecQ